MKLHYVIKKCIIKRIWNFFATISLSSFLLSYMDSRTVISISKNVDIHEMGNINKVIF